MNKQTEHTERFRRDLLKYATVMDGDLDKVSREMAIIMARNIIVGGRFANGTPVDTGFARGSWYPAMNGNPVDEPLGIDPSGQGAVALMTAAFLAGSAGMTFELWTNTAYMPKLEHGSSKQAPRGMVRTTVRAAQQIAEQAAESLRRG